MRYLITATLMAALLLPAPAAKAASLSDNPHSIGLGVGMTTVGAGAAFAMEVPYEYTFKVGPGDLAIHAGLLVAANSWGAGLGIPLGVRYKFHITKHPLYIGPTFDIGPMFTFINGNTFTSGFVRFGAILSYLVHPNVEVFLQPLGLGAAFGAYGGVFSYTLLAGAAYRF